MTGLPVLMDFDWDPKKAQPHLRQHGVSFDQAATVFLDSMAVSGPNLGCRTAEAADHQSP
jgi:uncharacterized DUF497 family protein